MLGRLQTLAAFAFAVSALSLRSAPIHLKTGRIDGAARTLLSKASEPEPSSTKYLIQHKGKIPVQWRRSLETAGVRILRYIPENAYLISVTNGVLERIRSDVSHSLLMPYEKGFRIDPAVSAALTATNSVTCSVSLFSAESREAMSALINAIADCRVRKANGAVIVADLSPSGVSQVAAYDGVEYVSPWIAPKPCNNVAVQSPRLNVETVWPNGATGLNLTGAGQIVAVADTGLDTGDLSTVHQDVRGRISRVYALGRKDNWSDPDGHGTHVIGSVLGNGAMSTSPKIRGVAYQATLIFQSTMDSNWGLNGIPADIKEMFLQAYVAEDGKPGARIHSNSWGSAYNGDYDNDSANLDAFCFAHPDMLVVVSAGNEGVDANRDGVVDLQSLDTPATAKNCLAVGASENQRTTGGLSSYKWGSTWPKAYPAEPIKSDYLSRPNDGLHQGMAALSSRGPCSDGRIKPDVVAPGTNVLSLRSSIGVTQWATYDTYYQYNGGTSMSAPLVSGAAALVRQWLVETRHIANPDAATVKALLLAGAQSLSPGQYGTGTTREIPDSYPNNVEGWGQVNLGKSLVNANGLVVSDAQVIQDEEVQDFAFTVKSGGSNLTVIMAYTDAPASTASSVQLVNDLDLKVVSPSGTVHYPNSLTSPDRKNNVEGVRIASAEAGIYRVSVTGYDVNTGMDVSLTGGKANAIRYSLVVSGAEAKKGGYLFLARNGPEGFNLN